MRLSLRRISLELVLDQIPRPRVNYVNEGPDWHFLFLGIGSRWSDPVISLEVNLGRGR